MNLTKALTPSNKTRVTTKVYYLPSYPFGERIFNDFRQYFSDYEWHKIEPSENYENVLVVGDSNAFTKNPLVHIQNSNILAINPIWYKTSPEPIWLSVPVVRNSFLRRMIRFRKSSLVDSYLNPHEEHPIREEMTEVLKSPEVWYKLLKNEVNSNIRQAKNNVFLLTNTTDPLRDVREQNSLSQYEHIWEWEQLSHSLLAFTDEQRLNLKQILISLTQDKGL
jgi:hypothetical protein